MAKILVADDSITIRKVAERQLIGAGFEVALASNGEEALARLASEHLDLAIFDVIMPDKGGYDLCTSVRSQPSFADLPVLLISGIVDEQVTKQAESCRADGVLKKPLQGPVLKDQVMGLLAKRQSKTAASEPAAQAAPPPASRSWKAWRRHGSPGQPGSGSREARPTSRRDWSRNASGLSSWLNGWPRPSGLRPRGPSGSRS